jgi:hypothetical protein
LSYFPSKYLIRHVYHIQAVTNNAAATVDLIVPKGKIWLLVAGFLSNGDNVQRTFQTFVYDDMDRTVTQIQYEDLTAGNTCCFPHRQDANKNIVTMHPQYLMPARWKVHVDIAAGGVSAGGNCQVSLWVVEFDEPHGY